MEKEPVSPSVDEWDSAEPDHPEIIDIREPTGFALVEIRYANDPELLTQNTTLALALLMRATDKMLVQGPEYDSIILNQRSQAFTDTILKSLISEDRRASIAALASSFTLYAGFSTNKLFGDHIRSFIWEKNQFLTHFDEMHPQRQLEQQTHLRDTVYLLNYASERLLDSKLDTVTMCYEGGDMSGFDAELFREYCSPFIEEQLHQGISEEIGRNGLSSQVRKRLICEAYYWR